MRGCRRQQGGLPDSGLAAQQQCPAAVPDTFDEIRDDTKLGLAPVQDTRRRLAEPELCESTPVLADAHARPKKHSAPNNVGVGSIFGIDWSMLDAIRRPGS
jgi:hypothetical protein